MKLLTSSNGSDWMAKKEAVNIISSAGRLPFASVNTSGTSGWLDLINRVGSGVICKLDSRCTQDIEVWADGILFYKFIAQSGNTVNFLMMDRDGEYKVPEIPYNKSILIKIRAPFAGQSYNSQITHVITG